MNPSTEDFIKAEQVNACNIILTNNKNIMAAQSAAEVIEQPALLLRLARSLKV